jgi:RsiW-degrading membrane proteinase PrsW (M82 family)
MKQYYITESGGQSGPYSEDELKESVEQRKIARNIYCWAEGMEEWKPLNEIVDLPCVPPPPVQKSQDSSGRNQSPQAGDMIISIKQRALELIDKVTELPPLKPVPWKRVTTAVFKKHTEAEADAIFTPNAFDGATPWFFSRILLWGGLAGALLLWGYYAFDNPILFPGYLFFAASLIPFTTFIFILELCGTRGITPYRIGRLLIVGGVTSLIFALIFFDFGIIEQLGFLGASIAGPVEESAKLLAAVVIARKWTDATSTRSGIIIGAAIGTGFAIFETAGYIFNTLLNVLGVAYTYGYDISGDMGSVILLRGILSPFCHIIWTALAVGALWRCRKAGTSILANVDNPKFYKTFILVVALHMIWNADFGIPILNQIPGVLSKALVLGFIGWYALLQLFLDGKTKSDDFPIPQNVPEESPESGSP